MLPYIEKRFVLDTYNEIAQAFSQTRYHVWNFVSVFLRDKESYWGLDIGCGNGKNMRYSNMIGIDNNVSFVHMCRAKQREVLLGDCCSLPFANNTFDYCMCIAVLHHMSTDTRRRTCLYEMIRVLRSGCEGVFNVWSYENQEKRQFRLGDNYVEWKSRDDSKKPETRYYYIMNYDMIMNFIKPFENLVNLKKIENEKGNWVVTFMKK